MNPKIVATKQGYAVFSDYNRAYTEEFKRLVPVGSRQWSQVNKVWYIEPAFGSAVRDLMQRHFGVEVELRPLRIDAPPIITKTLRLDYIGACKERVLGGEATASGSVADEWLCAFPESVLRAWFNQEKGGNGGTAAKLTLYATLGVVATVSDGELKSAFRRLARVAHPDVNHEQGAAEEFDRLRQAYNTLSDAVKRRKYDAGLAMEATTAKGKRNWFDDINVGYGGMYRPSLRCGLITAEWSAWLGRYTARKITAWDDITDERGRVMTSSWGKGDDKFTIQWVAGGAIPF